MVIASCKENSLKDVEKIFLEIVDHIVELMMDPFGITLRRNCLKYAMRIRKCKSCMPSLEKSWGTCLILCDMHSFVPLCHACALVFVCAYYVLVHSRLQVLFHALFIYEHLSLTQDLGCSKGYRNP